jgi:hypothetical protein
MRQAQNQIDLSYYVVLGWKFPATVVSVMFLGGVAAVIASAVTGGPWAFLLLFLFVVAGLAYGFLYHRAYVVRLSDGVLSRRGCAYHGSRPVSDVEAVTLASAGAAYVWTFRDGSRMTMMFFQQSAAAAAAGRGVLR